MSDEGTSDDDKKKHEEEAARKGRLPQPTKTPQSPPAHTRWSEKELAERDMLNNSRFIKELDEKSRLDALELKVQMDVGNLAKELSSTISMFDKGVDRIEKVENKTIANAEVLAKVQTQVQVLMDEKSKSWTTTAVEFLGNKEVKTVLWLIIGFIISQLSPSLMKLLLKFVGG